MTRLVQAGIKGIALQKSLLTTEAYQRISLNAQNVETRSSRRSQWVEYLSGKKNYSHNNW